MLVTLHQVPDLRDLGDYSQPCLKICLSATVHCSIECSITRLETDHITFSVVYEHEGAVLGPWDHPPSDFGQNPGI